MGDDAKLGLGIKLSYAMPRLACSLFSLHIGSKTRKYYTDGAPGISPSTLAMLVAVAVFIPLKALFESDDNVDEILA